MKAYYRNHDTSLRKLILEYLGFLGVSQERRCCVCDGAGNYAVGKLPKAVKPRVRTLPTDKKAA